MTLDELIQQLNELREEFPGDTPVRLAFQPQWPFEHSIGQIVACEFPDESAIDDEEVAYPVIYIGEGGQIGYLARDVANAFNWSR